MSRHRLSVVLAWCAGIGLSLCGVHAQLLDLDSSKAPEPGLGKAALSLAEDLEGAAFAREKRLADLSGNRLREERELAIKSEIWFRTLAASLLRTGESLGDTGSGHVVAGLRLAASLDSLDRMSHRVRRDNADAGLRLMFQSLTARPADVPDVPTLLDRWLRTELALLVEFRRDEAASRNATWVREPSRAGWAGDERPASLRPMIDRAIDDPTRDALIALDARCDLTSSWWAYRAESDAVRVIVTRAGNAADRAALPVWTSPSVRDRFEILLGEAIRSLASGTNHDPILARLQLLSRAAELLARVDRMSDDSSELRDSVTVLVRGVLESPLDAMTRLRDAGHVVSLLEERTGLGDEADVVRALRPAWRVLDRSAERAEQALLNVSPRLLESNGRLTDPSLVGTVAAHRRAIDDLRMLRSISKWVESIQPPDRRAPRGPARDRPSRELESKRLLAERRVLSLSQSVARDPSGEAIESLRGFADQLRLLSAGPGEAGLRAGERPWPALTGNRSGEIVTMLDDARSAWFEAWATAESSIGSGEDPERLAARLDRLVRLVAVLNDGVMILDLRDATRPGALARRDQELGLARWAGMYIAPETADVLADDVGRALPELVTRVLGADASGAPALKAYESDDALVRLIAHLHRELTGLGVVAAPQEALLVQPPPPAGGAWMSEWATDLRAISRYLHEYAAAVQATESVWAHELLTYLRIRCSDLLAIPAST